LLSTRLRPPSNVPGVISIVAAAKDLSAGVPLTPQDLVLVSWPDNLVVEGSISKVEDAVGRPLLVSIAAKQPLLQRQLAAPGSGFGLAGKIPDGMRATAVRSNDVVGVAGFLYPGSHLDVVATRTSVADAQPFAQTVLQDVEVLSTGTATEPDPQGKPQTVAVVTLLLSPEDSQKLLLASAQSTIQFVLRGGVDQQKVDIAPTRMDQLFGNRPEPPTQIAVKVPARPPTLPKPQPARTEAPPPPVVEAPKAPEPHIIEVIQGTQRTNQKF
jgi:pilus assembly protein CpaB